jgi:hypothetical protein
METLLKGEEAASGICALTGGLTEEDTALVFFMVKWFFSFSPCLSVFGGIFSEYYVIICFCILKN